MIFLISIGVVKNIDNQITPPTAVKNIDNQITPPTKLPSQKAIQNKIPPKKLNNYNFLTTYGFDRKRAINITNSINPSYFKYLNYLEIVYSNPISRSGQPNGYYFIENKKIQIFVYDESDNYVRHLLLHELKHHYCLTKEMDSFNKCLEINNKMSNEWDYCYHDEGCFLNTPIDKEYGFIK